MNAKPWIRDGGPVRGIPSGLPFLTCLGRLTLPVVLAAAMPAPAAEKPAPLRWNLQPGLLETYNVILDRRSSLQTYGTRQEGRLTRMVLAGSRPDQWNLAQMLELGRGRAVRLGETSAPSTATSGRILALLPLPHTQFSVSAATQADASLIVPGGSPFEKDLMRAMLEWGDWPASPAVAGMEWSREVSEASFAGERRFQVESFEAGARGETVARIRFTTEPRPRAGPANSHRVTQLDGTIRWAMRSGRLVDVRAHAVFTRTATAGGERIDLDLVVEPRSRTVVAIPEHNAAHTQVVELTAILRDYNTDRFTEAQERIRRFCGRWPASRWRPVADFLAAQIAAEQSSVQTATSAPSGGAAPALRDALAALLSQWRAAERQGDTAAARKAREELERSARVNRDAIGELARSADAAERALAVLGLAFGTAPADVAVISGLTQDDSPIVRESAYYALAVRRSPLVRADVFVRGLDDGAASVRARACEAAGASVRPGSPEASAVAVELAERLTDEHSRVRLAAAQALAVVGGREQVEPLRRAADDPANEAFRPALQAALRDLNARLEPQRPQE